MEFLLIASVGLNLVALGAFLQLKREVMDLRVDNLTVQDYILEHEEEFEDLSLAIQINYYDFLNYLHKTWHLRQDINGKFEPARYEWGELEELRLLNLKDSIDKELEARGIPNRASDYLEGL